MLDSQIILSYSNDGVAVATNHVYDKRAHERLKAEYRAATVVTDPALPDERISITVTEPKPSSTSYGTRRIYFNVRQEYDVETPNGTSRQAAVVKIEGSFPVGVTGAELEGIIGKVRAFVAHDVFKRAAKTLET